MTSWPSQRPTSLTGASVCTTFAVGSLGRQAGSTRHAAGSRGGSSAPVVMGPCRAHCAPHPLNSPRTPCCCTMLRTHAAGVGYSLGCTNLRGRRWVRQSGQGAAHEHCTLTKAHAGRPARNNQRQGGPILRHSLTCWSSPCPQGQSRSWSPTPQARSLHGRQAGGQGGARRCPPGAYHSWTPPAGRKHVRCAGVRRAPATFSFPRYPVLVPSAPVKCVCRLSSQPQPRTKKSFSSSYVAHCAAVSSAARACTPAPGRGACMH